RWRRWASCVFVQPWTMSASTSISFAVNPRVGASSLVGAARYAADTVLAQTPANDCSERGRPQGVKSRECLAQRILRTFSKSQRPLVRHADAFPGSCGCAPFTCDHQPVRLRDV